MLIDNVDDFATWLVNELKELCEADPFTLSKYVIALLKKDKSESNLKKICNDQLNVFLQEKTMDFVDNVFECLKQKTYLRITKPEENESSEVLDTNCSKTVDIQAVNTMDNIMIQNKINDDNFNDSLSGDEFADFRKISPRFRDINDNEDDKKKFNSKSYSKRSLDYSERRSSEESRKKRRYNDDVDMRERRRHSSRHRSHKSKRHVLDRIDQSSKHYDRIDDSKLSGYSNEQKPWNIKTSCPDFVEKGVCLKGDSCEFDHGANIVRSDISCIYSGINPVNVNHNWNSISMNQQWNDYPVSSKHNNKNLVSLKNIDHNNDHSDYRHGSKNNKHSNTDIYDPSHPEIDAKHDVNSRNGSSDQVPVYVPSKVESSQKEGSWWQEIDDASNNNTSNNYEGSQVTTIIGSGKNRSRRTVSPIQRGRFGNNGNNNSNNNFNTNNNYGNNNYNNNSYNNNNNSYNNNSNRNMNNNKFNNKRIANARCLLVTHIPVDCNDEVRLKQHFRAFGTITDVEVRFQNDAQHALIEFATVEEAKMAFRSPLPILDNRFIRTSLFSRPEDSNNLKVCKDTDNNMEPRDRRQVVKYNINKDRDSGDEMPVDKWPQHSQSSDEERTVVVKDPPKQLERKSERWPVASELRLDRRAQGNVGATEISLKDPSRQQIYLKEEKCSRLTEAQIARQKKIKEINDRKELDARIDRLEESVLSCKNRLRNLLLEQKNPDCDKDLVKRQLIESYNYYKELREMHESLKLKRGPRPEMSETDKLRLKIKNIHTQLADMDKDSEEYKKQLRMITELKRDLVKLQTISKTARPNRLPSLPETKLDNRPRTLYVTGPYCSSHTVEEVRHQMKKYLVEKVDRTEATDQAPFFSLKFKTRNEADRMLAEMGKPLRDKGSSITFERPVPVCDPLDFKTISDTQRGTPRDNCASSDEDDLTESATVN